MRIEIELDELDPPVGAVVRADGERRTFVGWLGLLRVLSEELDEPARPPRSGT